MSVYKRGDHTAVYSFDFWRGGVRFHGSTGETDRRQAEEVERKLKKEAEAQVNKARKFRFGAMSFDEAAGRYWTEVGQHTAAPDKLAAELERLVAIIGPGTCITDITDDLMAEVVAKRRQDFVRGDPRRGRISPAQVNRSTTQLLRRILTRAKLVWKQVLPEEPHWRAHILKEPKERVRELAPEEEAKLETVERDDYRPARLFAQLTGLRRREVADLSWSQVDFALGTIGVVGKGDKPHVLPMTDELRELLEPLRGHHPTAVFTYVARRSIRAGKGRPALAEGQRYRVTYSGLGEAFGRAFRQAGLEGFRVHDLRHTAATRTLRATGNLRLVQRMLAHSSPTVTAKYAHASLEDLREGMQRTAEDAKQRRGTTTTPAASPARAAEMTEPNSIPDPLAPAVAVLDAITPVSRFDESKARRRQARSGAERVGRGCYLRPVT